jgi:hypothetical protein
VVHPQTGALAAGVLSDKGVAMPFALQNLP